MARVQLFFQGKGMRAWEAEKTSRTLVELDSIYGDVELLAVKYDRLVSTLPDVDVKAMVANDPSVMGTEIKSNVERMLRPRRHLPGEEGPATPRRSAQIIDVRRPGGSRRAHGGLHKAGVPEGDGRELHVRGA